MSFAHLFSHSAWMQLGLSLAHFLWQGAVIAMLLAVVLFALRRRGPEIRHGLCLMALLAMGICPLATLWYFHANPPSGLMAASSQTPADNLCLVRAALSDEPPVQAVTQGEINTIEETGELRAEASVDPSALAVNPPSDAGTMADPEILAAGSPVGITPSRPPLVWGLTIAALAWAVGVAVLGVRFVFAWMGLRRLRAGTEALPEAIERLAGKLRDVLRIRGSVPVRTSRSVSEPLAFGLLRPIVLVPAALLTQCPVEMLEAMIAHELAHVRRHDLWINLLQRVIETLLFYHPAVWWVSGRMRLERELCCDDAAIRATGKRADYAHALVELSRSLHGWTAPTLSAGMFTSRLSLPERVRRVLQIPSTQHDPNRGRYWMTGPAALLLAGLLVLVSSLRPGVAQNAAPADATAATQPSVSSPGGSGNDKDNPKWWLPAEEPAKRRWENAKLADVLRAYSDMCGLTVVTSGPVIPADLQKPISVDVSRVQSFDEALMTLNTVLFEMNYWVVRRKEYLVIRPIAEWYRRMPPDRMYMSEAEYQKAKLPEWDVAYMVYEPRVWPAEELVATAMDLTPLNGARAFVAADGKRVILQGFVHFVNAELAIIKKWDVAPAPTAEDLARLRNIPGPGPRPPSAAPGGSPRATPAPTAAQPTEAVAARPGAYFSYGGKPQELPASFVPVRPLAEGIITEVLVKPGQAVKKGDLLVRLDDAEARIELEAAKTRLPSAENAVARYKELLARHTVSPGEAQEAETKLGLAKLEVQRWELRVDRARVRSPADGVVRVTTGFSGDVDEQHLANWIGKHAPAGEAILYVESGTATSRPAARPPQSNYSGPQTRPAPGGGYEPAESKPIVRPPTPKVAIRSPAVGTIQEIAVQPGQRVKKGDVLVKFDDQYAQLDLKAAQVRLASARQALERATQMHKQGTAPESEFRAADTAAALAEVELQRAQLQVARTIIRSPMDGVRAGFSPDDITEGLTVEAGQLLFYISPATQTRPAETGGSYGGYGPESAPLAADTVRCVVDKLRHC